MEIRKIRKAEMATALNSHGKLFYNLKPPTIHNKELTAFTNLSAIKKLSTA